MEIRSFSYFVTDALSIDLNIRSLLNYDVEILHVKNVVSKNSDWGAQPANSDSFWTWWSYESLHHWGWVCWHLACGGQLWNDLLKVYSVQSVDVPGGHRQHTVFWRHCFVPRFRNTRNFIWLRVASAQESPKPKAQCVDRSRLFWHYLHLEI